VGRTSFAFIALLVAGVVAVGGAAGAPDQMPKRGGTVVVAQVPPEPSCLNSFNERCRPGTSQITLLRIVSRVLESPFDVAPDFTWRPRLVSRVDFTRTSPFTLTYHIRPKARWSDGTPITAGDFVFTHEAILKHGHPDVLNHSEVRSVRAVDAKTVEVVLRSRFAGWRGLFGSILPRHALRGENLVDVWRDRIENPKTGAAIGSGPFLVERWERGKQITLRRNSQYWGPHVSYLDRITLRFAVAGGTLVSGFRSGEFQVAAGFPPNFLPDLKRESSLRTFAFPGSGWEHFEIRVGPGGHPALRSKLVRRALAFGIDRGPIVRATLGDIDPRARQRDSLTYPTPSRFYRPNWSAYRYRPSEARRLFELAGCRRGQDDIYVCSGQRLSLRFTAPVIPGSYRPRVIELVQAQLRRVGVEVIPVFATSVALFGQVFPSGAFDIALFAWNAGPDPSLKTIFGCGGSQNWTGYCQRLVSADLDQAERIFDADQQARVLNRVDVQLAKDVPAIPLFEQPQWAAVRSTIRGFAPNALDPLVNAETWWIAESR
jgi:peptide/nickel transport system substrate-binding protein